VRDVGRTIVHVHDAEVKHKLGTSTQNTRGIAFRTRYHQAWSRAYVCRKYGLTPMDARGLIRNALKLLGAVMILNRARVERYAGSVLGTLDAWRGRSAFDREQRI
jgi:GT2 family glycosyltransferase